ncbi:hypothetical protein HDIA_0781 [Hartmannibacter diazotrophicus]|uniref:Uncharacterized protein n=1 Tax=Hartmannibacter diazotrophicus TaxID=1482074 RepID=A0A2C9D1X1_9HYPH|nr:hypothetical protein [Hartmannibacter diazotrophicus]SON54322.1 hypothetical protein HDIA_0781 [Hartmannibacter diazotrophicus]
MAAALITAFAICTIHRKEKGAPEVVPASTKKDISLFMCPEDEFARLEGLQAARKATDDEIAIFERRNGKMAAPAKVVESAPAQTVNPPSSGAAGDPNAVKGRGGRKPKAEKVAKTENAGTETTETTDNDGAGNTGSDNDDEM